MEQFQVAFDQTMQVGESPLWHAAEQALYWVDIDALAVHRLIPASGAHSVWRTASQPSALAIDEQRGLLVATRAGILHLDTDSGVQTPLVDAPYDTSIVRFNDGRVDPAGRFWIGTIYEPRNAPNAEMYVFERGALRRAWAGGMTNSNGLAFDLDGSALFHADTTSHRVDRYPLDASGAHGAPSTIASFSQDKAAPGYGGRPDGATVDSEGMYWVAMFEGGRVLRIAPDGSILREIALPVRCPTSLAFGGADLRTLYITTASHGRSSEELARYPDSGKLLALQLDVAGRPEPIYRHA